MNIYFGVGRLTKDPEMVTTNSAKNLCKFTIAVNENYTQADGTRPVNFFNIIAWHALAERCHKYLKKGSQVAIVGKPQVRQYEAPDGTKKSVNEIVLNEIEFLSKKPASEDDVYKQVPMTPIEDSGLPF